MRFPEERLEDLHRRLAAARLPAAAIRGGGETPETVARLDELIAYWRDGYDWPAQAERIAALPHRFVTVDGVRLHAIVAEGKGPGRAAPAGQRMAEQLRGVSGRAGAADRPGGTRR